MIRKRDPYNARSPKITGPSYGIRTEASHGTTRLA